MRRYQTKQKTKDFRVLAKARPEESKIFDFFLAKARLEQSKKIFVFFLGVFWYSSRKMQAFGGKRCHFLRRYQKTKKAKDFRVFTKTRLQESKIFVFFVFLVPLQENASFWWKALPFPEEVPKNQNNQRF